MILAKCCHDLDILFWNLGPVSRLNSFGSLSHYRPENAPAGAPARCTDGCPHAQTCPWYAPRLYIDIVPLMHMARQSSSRLERLGARLYLGHPHLTKLARRLSRRVDREFDYRGWPLSTLSEDSSLEARWTALETGPYGRCVYRCDNDVVDHQTVNVQFESGTTATLCMHGHSHREGRTMRYDGTRATLLGTFGPVSGQITIHDHHSGAKETIVIPATRHDGHGGGDDLLVADFVRRVREGRSDPLTSVRESLESHLLAFAAERSRVHDGEVQDMDTCRLEALR